MGKRFSGLGELGVHGILATLTSLERSKALNSVRHKLLFHLATNGTGKTSSRALEGIASRAGLLNEQVPPETRRILLRHIFDHEQMRKLAFLSEEKGDLQLGSAEISLKPEINPNYLLSFFKKQKIHF